MFERITAGQNWRLYRRHKGLLALVLPGILFFLLFNYLPMLGLVIAFKDFRLVDGIMGSAWSGLDNFRRLFGGADFPLALRNTVTISLLRLCFGFFAPIALALMLNEIRVSWYKRTIQTVTYIPYFLSWVILGGIFLIMFAQNGPVNQLAMMVGIEPVEFLTERGRRLNRQQRQILEPLIVQPRCMRPIRPGNRHRRGPPRHTRAASIIP